jgi:glycerophosphoryl diester phosphodiesterase
MMFFKQVFAALSVTCALSNSAMGQLIIGHRGASHDAPENTIAAFKLAVEQGADGFEGDYWLNAGGQIVCLHDKDTKRVAGKLLSVTKAPFDKLRALDVGSWKDPKWRDERAPTFEECLAVVPAGKKFFVELKSGPEIVGPLAKVIAKSSISPGQIVFISFHDDAIAACKKQMPHIKAMWLCGFPKDQKDGKKRPTADEVAATLKRIKADSLGAEAATEYFNAEFIKRLDELGCREFGVWTVDDPKVAQLYAKLGAWSITTNRPGWLREKMAPK